MLCKFSSNYFKTKEGVAIGEENETEPQNKLNPGPEL